MNIADIAVIVNGAGGGGGGGVPTCNVTLIPVLEGEIVSDPIMTWSLAGEGLLIPNVYGQNIYQVSDPGEEIVFPIQIFNPGTYKVTEIALSTENDYMLWDVSEPIIEGSATYDPDGAIIITGDCTITLNVNLD